MFAECLYNLVHSLTLHFLKINFNIILPSMPLSIILWRGTEVNGGWGWSARLPPPLPGYFPYAPSELCQPVVKTNICVKRMTIQAKENRKYYIAGAKSTALRCEWGIKPWNSFPLPQYRWSPFFKPSHQNPCAFYLPNVCYMFWPPCPHWFKWTYGASHYITFCIILSQVQSVPS